MLHPRIRALLILADGYLLKVVLQQDPSKELETFRHAASTLTDEERSLAATLIMRRVVNDSTQLGQPKGTVQ